MALQIPYIKAGTSAPLQELSQLLDQFPSVPLYNHSWPQFQTECEADLRIAHTGRDIMLKFKITNDYFRSSQRKINGEVHLDNCVEFFIAFDQSDTYYNIEFNCLGIGKIAYGREKGERTFVEESSVRKIQTLTIQDARTDSFHWQMIWLVPAEVFTFHRISTFEGIRASGNFYNCGDALPQPHFLSWKRIDTAEPDFHRPDCFGDLCFASAILTAQEDLNTHKLNF
jgi:hypothetical protein